MKNGYLINVHFKIYCFSPQKKRQSKIPHAYGYWMNKLLPPDVKEFNKWFGDDVEHSNNGVVVLLPTSYSFSRYYHKFNNLELKLIIVSSDNYIFVRNETQPTIPICCQWDAEVLSLNNYIQYLKDRGIRL